MTRVRPARADDMSAARAIYDHHARHGVGTFDREAPPLADFTARWREIAGQGLPYLVAESAAGAVEGYAYAAPFRPRVAYRYTLEDSIYVAPAAMGRGVGTALLHGLMHAAEQGGARQLLAVIGGSQNEASIALHAACGFTHVGVMKAVGRKFGEWLDVVVMQRALGPGAAIPPPEEP